MLSNGAPGFLNRCVRWAQRAWPCACVLCGTAIARGGTPATLAPAFCCGCEASLPPLPAARCARCALPLASGTECGACLNAPPHFDTVLAAYAYDFPTDALIRRFKYGGDMTLGAPLARALGRVVTAPVDALLPMPLAPARLCERGFNQSHELARDLARTLGLPLLAGAVRRVSDTAPQAALPWGERAKNVRGAFVCDADLAGRHAAIVDDVMTTGATANELARVLKRAGAQQVSVWVVARTLRSRTRDR